MAKYTVEYLNEDKNPVSSVVLNKDDFRIRTHTAPLNLLHGGQARLSANGKVFASAEEFQFEPGVTPDEVTIRNRREFSFDLRKKRQPNTMILRFNAQPQDSAHFPPEENVTDLVRITYHK